MKITLKEKKFLKYITNDIIKNYQKYYCSSNYYRKIKKKINYLYRQNENEKKKYLGTAGYINFPYFKMGNIDTTHLFGIDEIIIFSFYYLLKKKKFKNAADLGANLGLHSIVLSKLGYNVKSYEPDTQHYKKMLSNLKLNKCKKVKTFRKAVSNNNKDAVFTKIINNTTGSFINNSKKKIFGPISKFKVKCIEFKKILRHADLLKIDVEGMEAKLFCSTTAKDWYGKVAIMEIGSKKNATKIFKHSKHQNIFLYSQKKKWLNAKTIQDLPYSHKEGSVIISLNKNNPWL